MAGVGVSAVSSLFPSAESYEASPKPMNMDYSLIARVFLDLQRFFVFQKSSRGGLVQTPKIKKKSNSNCIVTSDSIFLRKKASKR